ncbi:DUF4332 domain-containing protein [Lyngbya sp. PCC 8106]|uniref:DUF4332 domain-containing protein n=1 Tax=Lyngbya sp. (strain PCC 8106) TaxID=313612 RepID=UPI0000EA9D6A|nr:DUF4332 domain-containing protein [Lyngbya sp. PCC 8106]EAW34135.1 hypothetical protein L8106_03082 [Lyngbya sp. PCC 8106]
MAVSPSKPQRSIQACNWPIAQLPGLTSSNQQLLNEKCEITTTTELLQKGRTQAQKMMLANVLQTTLREVSKWVAMADLARIPSVGCKYCGLLLHAGIGSVTQLAQMPVHRLHQQVLRLHVITMQRRDLCPSVAVVQRWVQEAQSF